MADKRWWSIPRVFAFPLWNNSVAENVKKGDSVERSPTPPYQLSDRSSDDEEDIEEFIEKQRNARLGCKDTSQQVSLKSKRYSTPAAEEKVDDDKKFNRRSKRRHSRSSSKSSNSTKYSSAGKTSDTENEKIIKETIYEVTGSAPPISFSFFDEKKLNIEDPETEGTEDLYINSSIITEEPNQPDDCADDLDDVIDTQHHVNDPDTHHELSPEPPIPNEIESVSRRTENSSCSKERHITKLTILLSSVKHAEINDPVSETDNPNDVSDNQPEECGCVENNDIYSIIDKTKSSVSPTRSKSTTDLNGPEHETPDYAELSEFQSHVPEVTNMEYCQHRAKHKTRFRKLSLRRKRRAQPSLKKMNLNFNRAWKSLRGWWHDEKTKLGHLRPKSFINDTKDSTSSCSDRSFYESIRHLNELDDKRFTPIDEDGYCTLEPKSEKDFQLENDNIENDKISTCEFSPVRLRRKPPHPPPMRMSGVNAFRKSRYTIQVSGKNFFISKIPISVATHAPRILANSSVVLTISDFRRRLARHYLSQNKFLNPTLNRCQNVEPL